MHVCVCMCVYTYTHVNTHRVVLTTMAAFLMSSDTTGSSDEGPTRPAGTREREMEGDREGWIDTSKQYYGGSVNQSITPEMKGG